MEPSGLLVGLGVGSSSSFSPLTPPLSPVRLWLGLPTFLYSLMRLALTLGSSGLTCSIQKCDFMRMVYDSDGSTGCSSDGGDDEEAGPSADAGCMCRLLVISFCTRCAVASSVKTMYCSASSVPSNFQCSNWSRYRSR